MVQNILLKFFRLRTVSAKAIALVMALIVVSISLSSYFILGHFEEVLGVRRLEENLAAAELMVNPDRKSYTLENGILKIGDRVLNGDNALTDSIARVFHGGCSIVVGKVRVATSNKKPDGTRAIGTKLGADVIEKLYKEGKPFSGATVVAGQPRLSAYMPLKDANGKVVGSFAVGYARKDFMKTFYDARDIAIVTGLISLLICGVIGFVTYRRLFSPFRPLSALMADAKRGHYTLDVPYTDRSDEFGALAQVILDFNQNMKVQEQQRAEAEADKLRAAEAQKRAEEEAKRRGEELVIHTFGAGLKALAEERLSFRLNEEVPLAYQALKDNFNSAIAIFEQNKTDRESAAIQRENDRLAAEVSQKKAEEEAQARSMQMVVSSFGEGLKALAMRDLTFRMNYDLPPGYLKLQGDFNAALDLLSQAMNAIDTRADDIATGAKEISDASQEMATRTERQAASLEETSAAMEQVTATVKNSAKNIKDATSVAADAHGKADNSNTVAHATHDAMQRIAKSSGEIVQIIAVIDEIAFQTNLLALNAGVEAARAGEAGRGFAVVAQEVRALAQRSAEAAKEIKALIKTSESEVVNGGKLVEETTRVLADIANDINRMNEKMGEVSHAQSEQTSAMGEINAAVGELDRATQQNAAMAEEATAAARSMADNAKELASLIAQFKTRS